MNRSEDDIHVKEKVNEIVRNRLPGFASRYFSYNMDLKVPTLDGSSNDIFNIVF